MNRNILLLEPGYRAKFPPLPLMKLATYHRQRGDRVIFAKHDLDRSIEDQVPVASSGLMGLPRTIRTTVWDRIYITSLFSFEYDRTAKAIDEAIRLANGATDRVFVGGIAVTLMHERFMAEPRWRGVRFIQGMLDQAPAVSLQLDDFFEEYGADDRDGPPIDSLVPDYSILDQVDYEYPVRDAYFLYGSRGCVRKCSFCAVPTLEGELRRGASVLRQIEEVDRLNGPKRNLLMMDNNVVASPEWRDIIAEIRDAGFAKGATLSRNGTTVSRSVDFNQGVDARYLAKDVSYLKELSTIALKPLRIAFDHVGMRRPYETAIRMAHDVGLTDLSNYLLYNFNDTPADLYARMSLNIALNEELGLSIFSFPMRYHPITRPDRGHVGPHWTRHELRSMQVMLQASHGVVSGSPDFFRYAYGSSAEEFCRLLRFPEKMLFHRSWFLEEGGKAEREEFERLGRAMTTQDWAELLNVVSGLDAKGFADAAARTTNTAVQRILPFYRPLSREESEELSLRFRVSHATPRIPSPTLDSSNVLTAA